MTITLANQAQGQGTLELRVNGTPAAITTVSLVGIGELFVVAGQSNSMAIATNTQAYSHATLKAGMYGSNPSTNAWSNLSAKAWWPKMATDLMASQGVPVGVIPNGVGSTTIAMWQPGAAEGHYAMMLARIRANATLAVPPRCCLWWQGESDALIGTTRAAYLAALTALADALYADTGCKLMPCKLQVGSAAYEAIQLAVADAWSAGGNILTGPDFSDLTPSSSPHFVSDAEMATVGARWAAAIIAAFGW